MFISVGNLLRVDLCSYQYADRNIKVNSSVCWSLSPIVARSVTDESILLVQSLDVSLCVFYFCLMPRNWIYPDLSGFLFDVYGRSFYLDFLIPRLGIKTLVMSAYLDVFLEFITK